MPFYEYECAACGHQLEAMQKFSDAPLRKCPSCGKNKLKKLMSAPAFRLVGGGWYETDFKGDKDKKRNLANDGDSAADKPAEKPADKAAEKSTDKAADKPADKAGEKAAAKPAAAASKAPVKRVKKAAAKKRAR